MNAGDEISVEALELVAGGAALARVEGFPVFAMNLFPGDRARLRLMEVRKGFARGEVMEILAPSPLRRTAPCPIAGECGGCDWTALRLDAQLQAKERILRESLRRVGKIPASLVPPITIHPSPLNYRLRSRLHRQGDAIGFYALRSNRVVPLSNRCEVVGVETARRFGNDPGERIEEASDRSPDGLHDTGSTDETIAVWEIEGQVVIAGDASPRISRDTHGERSTGREADRQQQPGGWTTGGGRDARGPRLTVGGFRVTPDAFFQVNRHLLGTMQHLVGGLAARVERRRTAIDLYAGVGFFTAPLARLYDRVISVEGSPVSHALAKENLSSHVRVVHAAVEQYVERMPEADLIFLDPPRSGAQRRVIEAVAGKARSMVCFLACDPVTFARDASRLIASGWRLSTLDLLDLFPNTHHVETLSSFERAQ